MSPLLLDPLHGLVFAAVFLWAYVPEFRIVSRARRADAAATTSDRSLHWITRLGGISWLIATFAMLRLRQFGFVAHRETIFWAGVVLLLLGSLLRRLCWKTLGQYFTGNVTASADQRVIDSGPYRLIRHPSYSGGILMNVGTGLAMGNWISVAVMAMLQVVAYAYRISVEERALASTIGEPYVQYMARTKRLVPWII